MFMDITGINLFDQNVDVACPEITDIIGIDLIDPNVGMSYAEVRLRCSCILLANDFLIKCVCGMS